MTKYVVYVRVHGNESVAMPMANSKEAFVRLRAYDIPSNDAHALILGDLRAFITSHTSSGARYAVWCRPERTAA